MTQLAIAGIGAFFMIWFLDSRYRVLPASLHNALPAHHPGLVVVDITVATCSTVNVFSSCKLNPAVWHRVEKDLYLGHGWVSSDNRPVNMGAPDSADGTTALHWAAHQDDLVRAGARRRLKHARFNVGPIQKT